MLEFARCEYVDRRENVITLGNSGTGKTHVALGLGLAACQKSLSVGFTTTAAALVHELIEARDEKLDPSRKSGGALHRLHCFCLEFDGACEVQRRVPTDWIIEPIDVSGYGSFSLAS